VTLASPAANGPTPSKSRLLTQHTGYRLIKLGELTLDLAEQALAPLDLRARHFNVMAMVAADGTLSQQNLSGLLGLDPTIMVALVDDLEREGLLQRERSQQDRRRYVLELTPAGQRTLKRAFSAIEKAESKLLAPLSRQEADTLQELTGRLLARGEPSAPGRTASDN